MSERENIDVGMSYLAVRFLIGGLALLPYRLAISTGIALSHLVYQLSGGARRAGERNLELAFPELSIGERRQLLRRCFNSVGRQLGEFSHLSRAAKESVHDIVEFDQLALDRIKEAVAKGRGVIFLSGHIGAWELSLIAWSALQYPISFFARPFSDARVGEFIASVRTRFGNRTMTESGSLRRALRVLQDGGTIGVLADVNMPPQEGVFAPFFGHLACTTPGVAWLALRADAVVIPGCAVWQDERQRYFFHVEPPVELLRTGDRVRDLEINTARFNAAIEKMVRAYPDQYLWMHRRWLTRPAGEADLYTA